MGSDPQSFPELTAPVERRRAKRRRTRLRAQLAIGQENLKVDLLDFSEQGLRAALVSTPPASDITQGWIGRHAVLSAGPATSGSNLPSIEVRVVRFMKDEFGLDCLLPEAWLNALEHPQTPATEKASKPDADRLIRSCAGVYASFARKLANELLSRIVEQLAAREGTDPFVAQRAGFSEARIVLTSQRTSITELFVEKASQRALAPPKVIDILSERLDMGALRLMDSDELEDQLTLNGVISRLEKHFALELDNFETRYTRLCGTPVNSHNNPFGPELTLRSLRESFATDRFKAQVWRLIYELLESIALTRFGELLKDLNQIVARVEPAVRAQQPRSPAPRQTTELPAASAPSLERRLSRMEAAAEALLSAHLAGALPTPGTHRPTQAQNLAGGMGSWAASTGLGATGNPDGTAGEAPSDGRAEQSLGAGSLDDSSGIAARRAGTASRASGSSHSASPQRVTYPASSPHSANPSSTGTLSPPGSQGSIHVPATVTYSTGQTRRLHVIADLTEHTQRATALRAGQAATGPINLLPELEGAPQEARLEELLAAIDQLPISSGPAFSEAGLREVAAQFIEDTPEGPKPTRRISETHQKVLYTAVQLFQQASREFTPGSLIETLVKRLERTLLKLSLRDGEFPSSPEHPARKVIDLIDQYSLATDDHGQFTDPKLARNLEDLVERICSQADTDDSIFTAVQGSLIHDLERLKQERQQKVDRIREALESRDAIRTARKATDEALADLLSGRLVPRVLVRLIADCWRQHLVLIHMRFGVESRQWQAGIKALERALSLSQEGVELQPTLELREQTAGYIDSMLASHPLEPQVREELQSTIDQLLIQADAACLRDRIQAPRFEEMGDASSSERLLKPAIGEWWELQMDRQWVPVQMIWSSESTDYCGLVNRAASNRLELTYTDLRKQIDTGRARTRAALDVPLLDRSEEILLDQVLSEAIATAHRDSTTGMLSRKALQDKLDQLSHSGAAGSIITLALFEFDQFRLIASSSGFEVMESLARQIADTLRQAMPSDALSAVFREDSFAILLLDYSPEAARRTIEDIMAQVADFHFEHEQHVYRIGAAAGVGSFRCGEFSAIEMLRRVDAACMAAKSSGRNLIRFYAADDKELKLEESILDWAGRVESIFQGEELFLRCQLVAPIAVASQLKPYYEILLGIESSAARSSSPFEFVTAMERLGRAHEIDLWVLEQTFAWMRANATVFGEIGALSINLSATSLNRDEVRQRIRDEFNHGSVAPEHVIFEVTESAAIRNFEAAQQFIRELRRYGAKVSLDDFGSGYTSYAHLKKLSANTLKIDGSYVKDMLIHDSDLAIVKSMTDIAHTLGMQVVAEWVETPEILAKLLELGVDYAQGYAVHKPIKLSRLLSAR